MWSFFKPNVKRLQAKQDIDKLIQLLNHTDLGIISATASALGELEADDAVNPLAELLQIHGGDIAETSIEALETIGSNNAVNALIVVCETVSLELCLSAVTALGRIKNFNCVEFLVGNLKSKSIEVANSLGLIGDKTAIDGLVEARNGDHDDLNLACQKALHKIGYIPDKPSDQTQDLPQSAPNIQPEPAPNAALDQIPVIESESESEEANQIKSEPEDAINQKIDDPPSEEHEQSLDSDTVTIKIPQKFRELINAKGELPSLPDIVRRVSEKMKDPRCNLDDIANLIGADPVLTSRIVKVANSSRYSGGRAVSNFTTGMVRLGFKEIQNIVYSYALFKTFNSAKLINKRMFWLHSLSVGFCAQTLSILLGSTDEEQDHAYMSGLMHDVGIMVFGYLIPDSYRGFLSRVVGDHKTDPTFKLQTEENSSFHTDHAKIGSAYINHWWPVDDEVVICARDHHLELKNNGLSQTTRIVIVANMFCNSIGLHNGVNIQVTPNLVISRS